MLFVAGENLLPILVALLIGFITGLWIWKFARTVVVKSDPASGEDAPMRRPYVDRAPAPMTIADDEREPKATPRPEPEVLARRSIAAGQARAAATFTSAERPAIERPTSAPIVTVDGGDDLQTMKGVGPRLASLLQSEGLTRYEQIAALTPADLTRLDAHLGAFKGRLVRDRIVEQAALLAAGDTAGYERAFGRL